MKPWMKIAAGITLAASVIGFIIIWDVKIKDQIDSVEVVIVRPGMEILANETISKEHLMIEKRKRTSIVEGVIMPGEIDSIIGSYAKHHLIGNSILSARSIDFEGLKPNPYHGEAIRPIPNDWIYAKPSTVRRNDKIDLYLFQEEKAPDESESNVEISGLSPQQVQKLEELHRAQQEESQQYEKERKEIAEDNKVEVSEGKGVEVKVRESILNEKSKEELTDEEFRILVEAGDIPLLVGVPIIYAKDGSGNEVENGTNSSQEQRLTSTGTISDLELILTEDEYRSLKRFIEQGYKLYITYH